jgi:hypothetical protein
MPWNQLNPQNPVHPHELIPRVEKTKRRRDWDKENPPYTYRVPAPLIETAEELSDQVLAISQFDELGQSRRDSTSACQVAAILLSWAISKVAKKPELLDISPNPHGKNGKMTLHLARWDSWASRPIIPPPKKQKKKSTPRLTLSYRLPEFIDEEIRKLAGKHLLIGEVFVRLLQIGVMDYQAGQFGLVSSSAAIVYATGWQANENA